jgi:hypothetical protein
MQHFFLCFPLENKKKVLHFKTKLYIYLCWRECNRMLKYNLLLSRVYGSVTNNNGFWTVWLDLLAASFTSSLNYNQLYRCDLPTSQITRTRSILVLLPTCTPLYSSSHSVPSYNFSARTPRKTHDTCYQKCVFIGSLPSSGCPVFESVTSGMCLPSRCLAMIIRMPISAWHALQNFVRDRNLCMMN